MEFMNFEDLNYIFIKPKEFDETKQYPVILHLHGAGSRGSDLNLLCDNPFYHHLNTYESFPFVVFGPQCHLDTWFDLFEQLRRFSQYVAGLNFTDASRIYLMGASMGAYATWQLATSLPEVFAAAVPICGGGMYWNAGRLKDVPVWAFHGAKDDTVFCEESKKMVDAVNKNGGCARLTVYPENGHDSWNETYETPEVFSWLLAQQKDNVQTPEVKCCEGKQFG